MPKITELTAATALTDDDLLVVVDAPGGSAGTRKITALDAKTYLGGSTLLVGAVAPTGSDGAVGNYWIDTAGDDLYGPKSATGFGAEQRIVIANAPDGDFASNWTGGVRVTFTRAGRVTRVRYGRTATCAATLELRVWNSGGTQVGSTVNATDAGAGFFYADLASTLTVAAGSTYTFSVGSTGAIPHHSTAPLASVTNTSDCTWVGFYTGGSSVSFPAAGETNRSYWVEPVYEPDTGVWPLALETGAPADGSVTNAKLADMPGYRLKGRLSGTGAPQDLTSTQLAAVLPYFGSTDDGIVTASGGSGATFLAGDGTWSRPRRLLNNQTGTTYAAVAADENWMVTLSNAAAITVTLPSDATSFVVTGAEIDFLWLGVGQPTFAAGSGATVNGTPGLKLRARYSAATAKKIASNTWVVIGDLSA